MARWFRRKRTRSPADQQWSDEIVPRIKVAKDERLRLLVGQEDLVASLEALLFKHDPIGINFEENTDEYRPEAETIILRLPEANSLEDLRRVVHEEFVHWFDKGIAGPESRYEHIASEIWGLTRRRAEPPT